MHDFPVLFWWAFGLLQSHVNAEILLNDEGFPSISLGSTPSSNDISGPWSMQDLSTESSLATSLSNDDNAACPASYSGFVGKKRIRSNACSSDPSASGVPEEEWTDDKDLEWLWTDDEPFVGAWSDEYSAVEDDLNVQRAKLCPDRANRGHVLPVCSSGYQDDVSPGPAIGELTLRWCTLGLFLELITPSQIMTLIQEPDSNARYCFNMLLSSIFILLQSILPNGMSSPSLILLPLRCLRFLVF